MVAYSRGLRGVEIDLAGVDSPLVVPGDPGRLEQVFLNLLHNAGRAAGEQGTVWVRARRTAEAGAGRVEIVVEDDGPGIPEEVREKIFDPFFTTTNGTGLGLSISYGIVRAHGGTIEVGDRPGGGARFTLRLPAPPAASRRGSGERKS
jgi:signal transduction histidine kinase